MIVAIHRMEDAKQKAAGVIYGKQMRKKLKERKMLMKGKDECGFCGLCCAKLNHLKLQPAETMINTSLPLLSPARKVGWCIYSCELTLAISIDLHRLQLIMHCTGSEWEMIFSANGQEYYARCGLNS